MCSSTKLEDGIMSEHCTDEESVVVCGEWDEEDWNSIAWSACTSTCGGSGLEIKERCFTWIASGEIECETQQEDCGLHDCPGWGEWSVWGPCSADCKESVEEVAPSRERSKCWNDGVEDQCVTCGQTTCIESEVENCNDLLCLGKTLTGIA